MKNIPLENTPGYDTLVKEIVNGSEKKVKTRDEILREFDREKWCDLFLKMKKKSVLNVDDVIFAENNSGNQFLYYEKIDGFKMGFDTDIVNKHIRIYAKTLQKYTKNSSALVELGAGYGAKIFALSQMPLCKNLSLHAGELTTNGCELMKFFSQKLNIKINIQINFDITS